MQITVTADHIAKGRPLDRCLCPLALAFGEYGYLVNVSGCFVEFADGGRWLLPDDLKAFVRNFDKGCEVEPLTFKFPE